MENFEVVIPKLGESVIEATLTRWLKSMGEMVQEDEPIAEIATDKVDSEVISPVAGKLVKQVVGEGDVVAVGATIAVIKSAVLSDGEKAGRDEAESYPDLTVAKPDNVVDISKKTAQSTEPIIPEEADTAPSGTRFYSPLVRSIARQEHIPFAELDNLKGSGKDDRLTKQDLMNYLSRRVAKEIPSVKLSEPPLPATPVAGPVIPGEDRIVEMDRVRRLIANHMVASLQTSPHVTSFMEADLSNVVSWREKNKEIFQKRENQKLTFTPIFIDAIARSVRDFPMVNVSVDGSKIIIHKNIHVGMAVALPNSNLIVPVIRNAGEKSLLGLIKSVNDLAERARINKLVPDEITGGTISLTNLGSFGTLMGTPIINQPQTAIIATGAIKKSVVVIETPRGDMIAIRPMMMISVTYDHRVIDGSLGGQFLTRIVQYLENFDINQTI